MSPLCFVDGVEHSLCALSPSRKSIGSISDISNGVCLILSQENSYDLNSLTNSSTINVFRAAEFAQSLGRGKRVRSKPTMYTSVSDVPGESGNSTGVCRSQVHHLTEWAAEFQTNASTVRQEDYTSCFHPFRVFLGLGFQRMGSCQQLTPTGWTTSGEC